MQRCHVHPIGAQQDHVGLLSWRQGAGAVEQAVGPGSLDRGPLEHLPHPDRILAGRASQRTLQPEDGTHLVEHVGGHIGLDVDAETRFEARSRNFWTGGIPCPIIISTGVAIDTVPPLSTIIWISVSLSVVQWM